MYNGFHQSCFGDSLGVPLGKNLALPHVEILRSNFLASLDAHFLLLIHCTHCQIENLSQNKIERLIKKSNFKQMGCNFAVLLTYICYHGWRLGWHGPTDRAGLM
jgi:hypothetical protein